MLLHDVQAYRKSKEMYQRYKTQLFLVIVFIALLNFVGLYILLGASNGAYVACFLFVGSIIAYIFAYFGYNLLATHVLICSGFIFQFSVPFFTGNATFRAFLSTLPIAVSIFTLPDSLYHMLTWYFITSSAGVYMYFVHDPFRDIPYLVETEIEKAKRIKVEFATYQMLLLATLVFGLFLYSRVQSYVKRMSTIMTEIEKAGREAEAGVRAKDFLATMSHEIRTPLHGVLGMAQILNSSVLSTEQHEYVGEIIVLANNLISMVTNILDLSRVEADLYVLEPQSISVESLLNTLMCVVTRSVPGKSIGMNCVISAGVPRNVIVDSKRVLEIMFPIIASYFSGDFDVTIQADHVLSSPVLIINISNSEDQAAQTWQAIISAYIFLCSKGIVNKFRRRPSLLASTLSLLQAISSRAKANHITSSDHAGLSVALCLRILTLMHGSLSIDPKQPTNIKLSIPYSPDLTTSEKYEKDEVMNSCSCNSLAEHEPDPHEYQHAKLRYHVATCSNLLNNVLKLDSSSLLPTLRPHKDIGSSDDFIFDSSSGQYQYRWLMCIVCLGIMIVFAISTFLLDGTNALFYGSLFQIAVTAMATVSIRNHPEFSIHLILLFSGLTQQVSALYYDNHMLRSWSAILPYIVSIFTVPKFKAPLVVYTIGVISIFTFMYLWFDVNYPPANFVGTKEQLWDRVVVDSFILALITTSFATFSYFSVSGILHLKQNIDTHLETLISSKRAAEAGRRAGTFLSIVSHNIRTPLHSLLGATQLLSNMNMSPDQRDCVLQIQSCGNILMSLVTSVLNSTQMDTGMFVLEEQPVQLQEIVQSTLDVISVLANQKGIQLSGTIQQGVPKYVMGDRKYLLQILLNITGNAVKFTSKGKVTIEIKVETPTDISRSPSTSRPPPSSSLSPSSSPSPSSSIPHLSLNSSQSDSSLSPSLPSSHSVSPHVGNRLLLMVHDTGPGMDEATQAQLFQPYMQGDQSNSQAQSGSGLGLAICNRLAALMQGDIGMSSSPGKGSSFWMAIPLTPVVSTKEESPEFLSPVFLDNSTHHPPNFSNNSDNNKRDNNNRDNNNRDNNKSIHHGKGIRHRNSVKPFSAEVIPITTIPIRILIVDDNALNLKVATRALSRIKSAHIDVATNGVEAIEKITNGTGKLNGPVPYTTIFMDVQMPVMDGIEATKKIRMLEVGYPPVYIVGLSAHAEMETKRCMEAGMNQFVGKPFPVDDLISAVLIPLNNQNNNNNNNNNRSSKME